MKTGNSFATLYIYYTFIILLKISWLKDHGNSLLNPAL